MENLADKEFLTTNDLAEFLGVTRQAVQHFRELKYNPLPYYKVGAHIRFSYGDVRAGVERQRVKSHHAGKIYKF